MSKKSENNTSRLASLDILRGFDLFLLVFFQPVFAALVRQLNLPFLNDILYQFDHEVWEGFRFWDLVMPLFLFMTGASMPFSLSKYIGTSGSYRPVYRRILKRVFLLFVFGMIVQKSAGTGWQAYLSLFKHFAVYCCRLSYCGSHPVAFFVQVADRNNLIVAFRVLDSYDIFG